MHLLVALRLAMSCSGGLINMGLEILSAHFSGLGNTRPRYFPILARQR